MAASAKPSIVKTRRRTAHFTLGQPADLPSNQLPLDVDIFNKFKKMKEDDIAALNKDIGVKIAEEVIAMWRDKGNLPTYEVKGVGVRVEKVYARGKDVLKIPKDRRDKMIAELDKEEDENKQVGRKKKKIDTFEKLFDICPCQHLSREDCDCQASDKVAVREFSFLLDQRTDRKMVVSGVDDEVSKAWESSRQRKEKSKKYEGKEDIRQETVKKDMLISRKQFLEDQKNKDDDENEDVDETYLPPSNLKVLETNQNRLNLPKFSAELDRYRASDAAGAAFATSLLEDLGMITAENKKHVFDKFKIRRERKKNRKNKRQESESKIKGKIKCIGSDGKRDKKTKVITEKEINNNIVEVKEEITEEHIVYTDPLNYITHSAIDEGHGDGHSLGKDLVDVLREHHSEDSVECILSDGTKVMTGCYNGMIASAERELGKEVDWAVCQLHGNECPMRHVFQFLDGGHGTSGPDSFKGPIGQGITNGNCHLKDSVQFTPIKSPELPELPEHVVSDLSRDQNLLYRYSKAVDSGDMPAALARQKPGGINHARWLTFCLTALIDYTRDTRPSPSKVKFIKYIQQVYVPAWFIIKSHPYIKDGAKNVYTVMQLVKSQPKAVQDVAKKSIQTNAYFAHSSNLLLAMLADDDETKRRKAVNAIVKLRSDEIRSDVERTDSGLRIFRVPKLNWGAKDYSDIISWDLTNFCEPAITKKLSDDDLRKAYAAPLELPNHPNNSQSVERAVKMVSEACHMVYGQQSRHELILSRQAARQERPAYETKKDFRRVGAV